MTCWAVIWTQKKWAIKTMIIDPKNTLSSTFSRRRILKISATLGAVGCMAASPALSYAMSGAKKIRWRGIALGAEAEIQIAHASEHVAQQALDAAVAELRRLEGLFSLYDPMSLVSKLNRQGEVKRPPTDFLSLLSLAQSLSIATSGGFDVTVQPLWANPSHTAPIGHQHLHVEADQISFAQPDMAITLNGIAQGYITDRITEVLNTAGLKHVLVNAGEIRSSGEAAVQQPWRVATSGTSELEELRDQALAISSSYTPVQDGVRPHLFNGRTRKAVTDFKTVIVKAPNAALADALSTGLSVLPEEMWPQVIRNMDGVKLTVKAVRQDGSRVFYS